MGISRPRDLDALHDAFTRWTVAWRPDALDVRVAPLAPPATGLSSETFFVDVDWRPDGASAAASERASWVLRLPPDGEGLFPSYDLGTQGRLQAVLAAAGVRAVAPLAVEDDARWLGAPFLLMPRLAGRVVQADQPYLRTGWLAEEGAEGQARLHAGFLDQLAAIHRLDPVASGGAAVLAGDRAAAGGGLLSGAVDEWARYLAWAGEGSAPEVLDAALGWCRRNLPVEPAPSLLWGDVQLGNVLVADDMEVAAVLDFEMAALGPAEVDLAWYLVLHAMAVERCRCDLPGFPGRDATVAAYERRLGRPVGDLRWYEVFAAVRSGAILVRAARLLARLGVDDSWLTKANPTIGVLESLLAGDESSS